MQLISTTTEILRGNSFLATTPNLRFEQNETSPCGVPLFCESQLTTQALPLSHLCDSLRVAGETFL